MSNSTIITNGEGTHFVDIFLGGSCKTTWRENAAITLIKKHGLTYYNPAIRETNEQSNENGTINLVNCSNLYSNNEFDMNGTNIEANVIHWKRIMYNSRVVLFVITNDTRSLTTMILAAHFMGLDKKVVLCIQHLPLEDFEIDKEKVSSTI